MNLQTELERVREYLTGANPPPANEANTCDWVILPLLRHCGYHYHDIHAQGHDAAGGIPDYTILPNTAQTWYLEAKKWSGESVGYAHQPGGELCQHDGETLVCRIERARVAAV